MINSPILKTYLLCICIALQVLMNIIIMIIIINSGSARFSAMLGSSQIILLLTHTMYKHKVELYI